MFQALVLEAISTVCHTDHAVKWDGASAPIEFALSPPSM